MGAGAFNAWRHSINDNEPQHVIEAHQRNYRRLYRRLNTVNNKLFETKKERMIRDINQQKLLEQNAAHLRATQGENAAGP